MPVPAAMQIRGVSAGLAGKLNAACEARMATWTLSPLDKEERYDVATPRWLPWPDFDGAWRMEKDMVALDGSTRGEDDIEL